MACTIDSTVGGAAANSYISIADANLYHETHPYSEVWDNADTNQKCRALQTATRLLDQWYDWAGTISGQTQRLLWPRAAVYGPAGYLEANDEVPERIKHGTAELARLLLAANLTADSDLETQGITGLKAGSVELTFSGQAKAKAIPNSVAAFVGFYGREQSRSGGAVSLKRG